MAGKTAQTIYDEITDYISKQGGALHTWYAGITENPKKRLFDDHKVPEKDYWWIYRRATSSQTARDIEKALLDLGCDGGAGGGDDGAVHVYAYLKSPQTQP